jgi:hypothetical protein
MFGLAEVTSFAKGFHGHGHGHGIFILATYPFAFGQ